MGRATPFEPSLPPIDFPPVRGFDPLRAWQSVCSVLSAFLHLIQAWFRGFVGVAKMKYNLTDTCTEYIR